MDRDQRTDTDGGSGEAAAPDLRPTITVSELRAREPKTGGGRYNVRDAEGKTVKRGSPEYYAALGIDPNDWNIIPDPPKRRPVVTPPPIRKRAEGEGQDPDPGEKKIRIEAGEPRRPRPVPEFPTPPGVTAETDRQAAQAAMVLLTVLDGLAGIALGEGARMTRHERALIEDPLTRILSRMDPGTNEMIEKYTDPILLVFGIASWGYRVYSQMQALDDGDDSGPGAEPPPEPAPPGGRAGENGHLNVGDIGPAEDLLSALYETEGIDVSTPAETPEG